MRVTALWKHDCVVVFSHVCSFSSGGTHTHINTHAHTHTAWWLDSAELLFILLADNSLIRTKTANVFSSYFISSVCCKWMLERLMHHSIDYVRYKCHLSPGGVSPLDGLTHALWAASASDRRIYQRLPRDSTETGIQQRRIALMQQRQRFWAPRCKDDTVWHWANKSQTSEALYV